MINTDNNAGMSSRIRATYVRILKHNWQIEKPSLISRFIHWFIGRPYTYRLVGWYVFTDGDFTVHQRVAIDINLYSGPDLIHEYGLDAFATTKTKFMELP